jgi:hypothetical protein
MLAPERKIPRANLVMNGIIVAMGIVSICLVIFRPTALVPFGRLLSARSWRTLHWVCTSLLYGMTIYAVTKGRRKPTAPR